MIVLYSTGCPKCNVLKNKLAEKHITYIENNSVEDMRSLGIDQVPVLEVDNDLMEFKTAVEWINKQ